MNTGRRDLLKLTPLAVAAAATSIGRSGLAESPTSTTIEAIFNVRTFGATGDGKTVNTPELRNVSDLRVAWSRAAKDSVLSSAIKEFL